MTDISDGLSTSLREIASSSEVGVMIDLDKIPVDDNAQYLAEEKAEDIMEHSLYGEGDYELLFTVSEKKYFSIKERLSVFAIGRVTEKRDIMRFLIFNYREGERCYILVSEKYAYKTSPIF